MTEACLASVVDVAEVGGETVIASAKKKDGKIDVLRGKEGRLGSKRMNEERDSSVCVFFNALRCFAPTQGEKYVWTDCLLGQSRFNRCIHK